MFQQDTLERTAEQCQEVSRIFSEMDRTYHRLAQRTGLSDCAFWVMYALGEHAAPLSQKSLVEGWCYAKQTVSSALKMLIERRLIRLEPAAEDRRSKVIELTEAGERFLRDHVEPTMLLERCALESLTPADREQLVRLLSRYVSRLTEETMSPTKRPMEPAAV
ncbi:regulatory protein MarR [Coriobacterium glomerans PW2]|uniref:Regulatory protein MarR n=1 Tax=Coriobacterium glomerans (strain ATCC 49209 / DSM 20642 / JCM 10262 / PW2) TaxID=700015 RepID=F2NAG4_CORGP|nr:MarR family transcriptional regulator [Coriobacterium glomerans]AEB06491.1 regulatory protein MarR [Coriobacterium glomerans PW2]